MAQLAEYTSMYISITLYNNINPVNDSGPTSYASQELLSRSDCLTATDFFHKAYFLWECKSSSNFF